MQSISVVITSINLYTSFFVHYAILSKILTIRFRTGFIWMIILKIKDRWYHSDYYQAVNEIEKREHDDDEPSRFEENAGFLAIMD